MSRLIVACAAGWVVASALFCTVWAVYVGRHKHKDPT